MLRTSALCLLCGCATSPPATTAASLTITPDGEIARAIGSGPASAYVLATGDAWQLVFSSAPAGTSCARAPVGAGTLTFFLPTQPPLASPPDGSIAEPIDIAVETTPLFPSPHAELDLAVATRETVGGLYFTQTGSGFAGHFDATSTAGNVLLHVAGSFDAPICTP